MASVRRGIAIVAVAQNIPEATTERFRTGVLNSTKLPVSIVLARGPDTPHFYKTRLLNAAMRDLCKRFAVIIQTDIDVLVPPYLIDSANKLCSIRPDALHHHRLRYITEDEIPKKCAYKDYPWKEWRRRKATLCTGCWNAGTAETWLRSGGWNEDMYDWGAEDTEFFNRTKRNGIRWTDNAHHALVHVAHLPRTTRRGKENMALARQTPISKNWLTQKV